MPPEGDDGDRDDVRDLRDQRQVRGLVRAPDPTAFVAFGYDQVHTLGLRSPCMSYGGYLMEYYDVASLEHAGVQGRAPAVGYCYPQPLLDGHVDQAGDQRVGQVKTYAEGACGQPANLPNVLPEVIDHVPTAAHTCRGVEYPQAARVRHGGHQLWVGHPGHPRLQDGAFDTQNLADPGRSHPTPKGSRWSRTDCMGNSTACQPLPGTAYQARSTRGHPRRMLRATDDRIMGLLPPFPGLG